MKKSDELRASKTSKIEAQRTMLDAVKVSATKEFTPEQRTAFDGITSEIEAFDAQIRDAVNIEVAEARIASLSGASVSTSDKKEQREMVKNYSLHKALRSQLPNGKLDGIELEYHQEMLKEARNAGVSIEGLAVPNGANKQTRAAGQTVSQDAGAYGANLVNTDYKGIIDALRPTPVAEQLGAVYMRGLTGDVKFVTNGGGIAATWETEIATTAASKTAYGTKTMSPKRLSATVPISLQNILQSTPGLEALTAADIKRVTEIAIDLAVINGAGSGGVPEGILNNSDIYTLVGATNGIAPTWAQLVKMETEVLAANAGGSNMSYLITPGLKGFLKQTAHAGSGNWNYLMAADGTINGYNAVANTMVPSNIAKGSGTNLHAAVFGDFSNVLIGEWGFYDMVVDNITQKKAGLIEITVNQFLDILIRQGAGFAVSKDFIV
jgi:HK97 family phage major capsid protein